MKQRSNHLAVLIGIGALACSEAPAPTSMQTPQAGTGGQGTTVAGGGGSGAMTDAGSAGTTPGAGGTPAASGAGGGAAGGAAAGAGGGGGAAGNGGSGGADDGWIPLFNGKNLDGWTPSPGRADYFGVSEIEGGGVLHVYPTQADQSDQTIATIRTNDSFSSYVFYLEYKWGPDRFGERKQTDKDNGICFHLCGNLDQVWPESLELQIGSQAWPGDWVVGNIFMLINKTRAQWPYTMMNGQEVFSANGTKKSIGAPASYYKGLAPSQLNLNDEWNIIELTVHGSRDAEFKVNGTVVNQLFDMECNADGTWKPLDQGPIALQAEWAEVYFRNIRIKVLP
jgi:hypothetical protein